MKGLRVPVRRVLPTLLGILFVAIGVGKFRAPGWERNFLRWGYPPGAHMVVGVIELVAGAALMFPRLTTWVAAVLECILVGAIATHLWWGETNRLFNPILYMALLALAAWVRRREPLGAPPWRAGGTGAAP